jgi:hypothetical protein
MALIYKPNSEPMKEINRLINEARISSNGALKIIIQILHKLIKLTKSRRCKSDLATYPEKKENIWMQKEDII